MAGNGTGGSLLSEVTCATHERIINRGFELPKRASQEGTDLYHRYHESRWSPCVAGVASPYDSIMATTTLN